MGMKRWRVTMHDGGVFCADSLSPEGAILQALEARFHKAWKAELMPLTVEVAADDLEIVLEHANRSSTRELTPERIAAMTRIVAALNSR